MQSLASQVAGLRSVFQKLSAKYAATAATASCYHTKAAEIEGHVTAVLLNRPHMVTDLSSRSHDKHGNCPAAGAYSCLHVFGVRQPLQGWSLHSECDSRPLAVVGEVRHCQHLLLLLVVVAVLYYSKLLPACHTRGRCDADPTYFPWYFPYK